MSSSKPKLLPKGPTLDVRDLPYEFREHGGGGTTTFSP